MTPQKEVTQLGLSMFHGCRLSSKYMTPIEQAQLFEVSKYISLKWFISFSSSNYGIFSVFSAIFSASVPFFPWPFSLQSCQTIQRLGQTHCTYSCREPIECVLVLCSSAKFYLFKRSCAFTT